MIFGRVALSSSADERRARARPEAQRDELFSSCAALSKFKSPLYDANSRRRRRPRGATVGYFVFREILDFRVEPRLSRCG